jgi:hypothetical protein
VRELLRDLAAELTPEARAAAGSERKVPRAAVVGQLAVAEREELRAMLWGFGVGIDFHLDQPWRRPTVVRERLQSYRGPLVIVLQARCRQAAGQVLSWVRPEPELILAAEEQLDLIEIELEDELERLEAGWTIQMAGRAPAEQSKARSWSEVVETVEGLVDEHFVMSDRGWDSLRTCDFYDPARMEGQLQRFAELARAYGVAGGDFGERFEDVAKLRFGLSVSLHDQALAESTFEFENQQHSWEPHVQIGQATHPDRCGRIYFALDSENARVIVYHIGRHL